MDEFEQDSSGDLNVEILEMLLEFEDGLTSEEIFQKSQIAIEKGYISRRIGGLRTAGKITVDEHTGERKFRITSTGKKFLREKGSAAAHRIPIIDQPDFSILNKIGFKQVEPSGKLSLVAITPSWGFRCMLSSDANLIIESPIEKEDGSSSMQRLELTQEQTKILWEYMCKLYPLMSANVVANIEEKEAES